MIPFDVSYFPAPFQIFITIIWFRWQTVAIEVSENLLYDNTNKMQMIEIFLNTVQGGSIYHTDNITRTVRHGVRSRSKCLKFLECEADIRYPSPVLTWLCHYIFNGQLLVSLCYLCYAILDAFKKIGWFFKCYEYSCAPVWQHKPTCPLPP